MEKLNGFSTLQLLAASSMFEALLPLLLVVANVMGVGMILPQVLRIRRDRCTEGVSGSWVGVGLTLNLWWLAYGIQTELWGLLPVSAGAFVLYAAIATQMVKLNPTSAYRQLLFGMFVLGGVPLPFLIAGGWTLAGLAIGCSYGVQFLPAAVEAYRSPSVAGVSVSTWVMAWIEAAIWLLYGLDTTDPALLFGGSGGLAVSSFILVLLATKPGGSGSASRAMSSSQLPAERSSFSATVRRARLPRRDRRVPTGAGARR